MRLLRSGSEVTAGELVDLTTLRTLADRWYGNRLAARLATAHARGVAGDPRLRRPDRGVLAPGLTTPSGYRSFGFAMRRNPEGADGMNEACGGGSRWGYSCLRWAWARRDRRAPVTTRCARARRRRARPSIRSTAGSRSAASASRRSANRASAAVRCGRGCPAAATASARTSGGSSTPRPAPRSSTTGSRARPRSARSSAGNAAPVFYVAWPAQVATDIRESCFQPTCSALGRRDRAVPENIITPPAPMAGVRTLHFVAQCGGTAGSDVPGRRQPARGRDRPLRHPRRPDHAARLLGARDRGAHRPARGAGAHARGHDDGDRARDRRRRGRRLVHARGRRPGGGQRRRARLPGGAVHRAHAVPDRHQPVTPARHDQAPLRRPQRAGRGP